MVATDCMGQDTECQQRTCVNGYCGISNTPGGTPLMSQTEGDCLLDICDGAGNTATKPVQLGTACGDPELGLQCDFSGQCRAGVCNPGTSEACYSGPAGTQGVGVCTAGIKTCSPTAEWGPCMGSVVPSAEICGTGVDADCDGLVAADCPGNECTQYFDCGPGTECLMPTCIDGYCGSVSYCGTCQEASTCGVDQECHWWVCTSGLCDVVLAAPGTPCGPEGMGLFCAAGNCM